MNINYYLVISPLPILESGRTDFIHIYFINFGHYDFVRNFIVYFSSNYIITNYICTVYVCLTEIDFTSFFF